LLNACALAEELAIRLAEVLPPGFNARAEGVWVHIGSPDGLGAGGWAGQVDDPERGDAADLSRYALAAWTVLNTAQDVISETTGLPWPRANARQLDLALPDSRVEDGVLYCWFGDARAPVLSLRPLSIVTL
jgi:hypothetical protein